MFKFAGFTFPKKLWALPKGRLKDRLAASKQFKFTGDYYSGPTPNQTDGWGFYLGENVQFALRITVLPNQFQADDDTVQPIIARLPKNRGLLAGYTLGEGMASGLSSVIHADTAQATRAALHEAWQVSDAMIEDAQKAEESRVEDVKRQAEAAAKATLEAKDPYEHMLEGALQALQHRVQQLENRDITPADILLSVDSKELAWQLLRVYVQSLSDDQLSKLVRWFSIAVKHTKESLLEHLQDKSLAEGKASDSLAGFCLAASSYRRQEYVDTAVPTHLEMLQYCYDRIKLHNFAFESDQLGICEVLSNSSKVCQEVLEAVKKHLGIRPTFAEYYWFDSNKERLATLRALIKAELTQTKGRS